MGNAVKRLSRLGAMKFAPTLLVLISISAVGCRSTPAPCSGVSVGPAFETHYSPAENLEAIDNRLITSAHSTLDLCAYSLTDHQLGEALLAAARRGVHVRIYLDQVQTQGELSREDKKASAASDDEEGDSTSSLNVLRALDSAANVEVRVKRSKTLMHLKSYAVDGAVLRSGSANFSPTGEKRQDNDLTLTSDPDAVARFERNFAALWARPDNGSLTSLRR